MVWNPFISLFKVYPLLFLYAVFVADWRVVLAKSGCWERNAHQSLSVTPMEPHGQACDTT